MGSKPSKDKLTVSEFARQTGFSDGAVRNQIEKGNLPAFRLGARGSYRIPISALQKILSGIEEHGDRP
jgi:excisionase family DNA binding protein